MSSMSEALRWFESKEQFFGSKVFCSFVSGWKEGKGSMFAATSSFCSDF